MAITRITANWSGFRGAPGYSNFFFAGEPTIEDDAVSAADAVRNFLSQVVNYMPSDVTISIDPVAVIIDEANGAITGEMDFAAPAPVNGGSQDGYSAASGAVVNWNTQAYRNGRRIRGRTFLVPLSSVAYDSAGDLTSAALDAIRDGAVFLTSGASTMPFVVWSRPVGGSGGTAEPVTSSTVPDLGAILRSRRD